MSIVGTGALVVLLCFAGCDTGVEDRGYDLAGAITSAGGPVSSIEIRLEGGFEGATVTDADGRFAFIDLPSGRSYTVRPVSSDFAFEPASVTINRLDSDRTVSFQATSTQEIVGGVNLTRLFAPATPAEVAAVAADWATRTVQSHGYSVEYEAVLATGVVRIISHLVDGHRHYAMIHLPPSTVDGTFPIIVVNHGGDVGIDSDEYLAYAGELGDLLQSAILVLPVFRSESIRHDGREYVAEGSPSTWDRDVDDALGAMQVVLDNEPRADASRIATIGFSRGGGVSLLMSIREPRIQAAVTFFGPTDFFDNYVRQVTRTILQTDQYLLPGSRHLTDAVLRPLQAGTLSYEDARLELVRRSPVLYANRLSALQVHHGTSDIVVWVSQAHRLDEAVRATGRTSLSNDYEFHIYEGAGHSPEALTGSLTRTADFLFRHLSK
jgi:dipeptidyl aminopeptidase/acylaminoacyl peptidase